MKGKESKFSEKTIICILLYLIFSSVVFVAGHRSCGVLKIPLATLAISCHKSWVLEGKPCPPGF